MQLTMTTTIAQQTSAGQRAFGALRRESLVSEYVLEPATAMLVESRRLIAARDHLGLRRHQG
jgi:hypothetical protein